MVETENQFIFITKEGNTIAPNVDYTIENCQVLGLVNSINEKEAKKTLITENPWIESSGFDMSCARGIQVLTENIRNDIHSIVDYLWKEEERHYEESIPKDRENHIYNVLRRLSKV